MCARKRGGGFAARGAGGGSGQVSSGDDPPSSARAIEQFEKDYEPGFFWKADREEGIEDKFGEWSKASLNRFVGGGLSFNLEKAQT